MHKLYELKEKLMKELEDYAENGKFSEKDVESIKYITSSIDHICNIMENADEEYSNDMYSRTDGQNMYSRDYMRGNSYARGRGRNAKRDSMGRYSSRMYSGADESMMVEELRSLMESAPNEQIRAKMRMLISEIESM
jgi:hypothetical protein